MRSRRTRKERVKKMALYEIVEIKRENIGCKWHFVARPVPQPDIDFICLHETTCVMEDEIWRIMRDEEYGYMVFAMFDKVFDGKKFDGKKPFVLQSLNTTNKNLLPRYKIISAVLDEDSGWHFTAHPFPVWRVEFICDNESMEQAAWNATKTGDPVELEFQNMETGIKVLKRITTPRTGDTAQATNRHE